MWEEDDYADQWYQDDVEEFELNQLALDQEHDQEEDDDRPETD